MKVWEGERLLGTAGKVQPVSFLSGQWGVGSRVVAFFLFLNIQVFNARVSERLGLMFQDKLFQVLILK